MEDVDGAGSERVPHGHLVGARVRGRHDAQQVVRRQAQDALRLLDRVLQLGLQRGTQQPETVSRSDRGWGDG